MRMAWLACAVVGLGCHASSSRGHADAGGLDGAVASAEELTGLVDPRIGTGGAGWFEGDTFAGATFPLGMVQWSPDTVSNPAGGYNYADNTIKGFSLTHFSG